MGSARFAGRLTFDAVERLGACAQSRLANILAACLTIPEFVLLEPAERTAGKLEPRLHRPARRFQHLLLLDRIDAGDPTDRGLIQFYGARRFCGIGQGLLEALHQLG